MPSNHKLLILIRYVILTPALLTFGYELLRPSGEPDVSISEDTKSDNRLFFWDIYPELVVPNTGKVIDKELNLRNQHEKDMVVRDY